MTKPEFAPSQHLWSARILAEQPPDPQERSARLPIEIAQTVWCTPDEARDYLSRRMPTAQLPAGAARGSAIVGRICPARAVATSAPGPDAVHTLHVDLLASTAYRLCHGVAVLDHRFTNIISRQIPDAA